MPRRNLSATTSWDDIYNYLAFVAISLELAVGEGDKELTPLVPPVHKLIEQWEAMDGERRSRRTAIIRANALVALRNRGLDGVTTDLHNAALGAGNQSRQAPLFTHLFPRPLSQVVMMALEAQLPVSRVLLHKLGQDATPAELRKAHEAPLTDSIAAGDAAIKGRELVQATAQEMKAQITALREECNRVLLTTEGRLKAVAGKRGLSIGFVHSFFPEARPPVRRRAAPAPAPTAAPAAG